MNKKILIFLILIIVNNIYPQNYSWKEIRHLNARLKSVFFKDSLTGWIVGNHNEYGKIFKTNNAGYTWVVTDSVIGKLSDIFFANQDTGWVVGYTYVSDKDLSIKEGLILKTIDGGESWNKQNFNFKINLTKCDFVNSKTGWIKPTSTSDTIFFTNDGGMNWQAIDTDIKERLICMDFSNENIGWIGSDSGKVYKTFDGGFTWNLYQTQSFEPISEIKFIDEMDGWGISSVDWVTALLKTIDGGSTWILEPNLTPCGIFSLFFIDKDNGWASGCNEILHTKDGGFTWTQEPIEFNTGGNITFKDIFLIDSTHGWAISDDKGLIFKTSDDIFIDTSPTDPTLVCTSFIINKFSALAANWVDYNNDSKLDIFLNISDSHFSKNRQLYKNQGNLIFERIIGNDLNDIKNYAMGSCWADYDNDGDMDLLLATTHNIFLYNNLNGKNFQKIDFFPQIDTKYNWITSSWVDVNNDGFIDFFVTNNQGNNVLYIQDSLGHFVQMNKGEIVTDNEPSEGCAWADFDNDGDLDVFVANSKNLDGMGTKNSLYINLGDGLFSKSNSSTFDDLTKSVSCCWGDYNNDGYLDLFVANKGGENNLLYLNTGVGNFLKINNQTLVLDGGDSYSSNWIDFNNDALIDIFIGEESGGRLYLNNGNLKFSILEADGIPVAKIGQSWGDYDKDGDLDLVSSYTPNLGPPSNYIFKNNGNSNNWINIKCIGTYSNKSAIGARLTLYANIDGKVTKQIREISGGIYGGQNSLNVHFGLKDANSIDSLIILWPSGLINKCYNLSPNQFLEITEQGTPPRIILPTLNDTTYPGNLYEFHPILEDNEDDNVKLILLEGPIWMSVKNDTILQGTPGNYNTGTYKIYIRADDNHGGITDTCYNLTVLNNLPPVPITDFELIDLPNDSNAFLKWTAPGNHWTEGKASKYEIRYSKTPINESNFSNSIEYSSTPIPSSYGIIDSVLIEGLEPSTTYYVAIKSINDDGQISSISNVVKIITNGEGNTSPPEIISRGNMNAKINVPYHYDKDDKARAIGSSPIYWSKIKGPKSFNILNDGLINWTPTESDSIIGSLLVIIRAENTYGFSDDSLTIVLADTSINQIFTADTTDQFLDFSDAGVTMPEFVNESNISGEIFVNKVDTIPEIPGSGTVFTFGNQFWVIDSSVPDGSFSTTLVFYYDETKLDGILESEIVVTFRENEEDDWQVYPDQKLDTVRNSVTLYNVNHFSIFAPADDPFSTKINNKKEIMMDDYLLFQNYPNPFNPSTTIKYDLPKAVNVRIDIFNILGQKIRTLVNKKQAPGRYSFVWDGKDDFGRNVASGIYLYQIKTKDFIQTKKMILIR